MRAMDTYINGTGVRIQTAAWFVQSLREVLGGVENRIGKGDDDLHAPTLSLGHDQGNYPMCAVCPSGCRSIPLRLRQKSGVVKPRVSQYALGLELQLQNGNPRSILAQTSELLVVTIN